MSKLAWNVNTWRKGKVDTISTDIIHVVFAEDGTPFRGVWIHDSRAGILEIQFNRIAPLAENHYVTSESIRVNRSHINYLPDTPAMILDDTTSWAIDTLLLKDGAYIPIGGKQLRGYNWRPSSDTTRRVATDSTAGHVRTQYYSKGERTASTTKIYSGKRPILIVDSAFWPASNGTEIAIKTLEERFAYSGNKLVGYDQADWQKAYTGLHLRDSTPRLRYGPRRLNRAFHYVNDTVSKIVEYDEYGHGALDSTLYLYDRGELVQMLIYNDYGRKEELAVLRFDNGRLIYSELNGKECAFRSKGQVLGYFDPRTSHYAKTFVHTNYSNDRPAFLPNGHEFEWLRGPLWR